MSVNPYESPRFASDGGAIATVHLSPDRLARVSIAVTVLSLVSIALSTRFVHEWLPMEWQIPWLFSWIKGAVAMWLLATALAVLALMGRRTRTTKAAIVFAQSPLLLPLFIVVKWLFVGV
jgi:hypothetical protein